MSDSRQPAGEPVRQGEGADGFPTAVNIPCSSVEDCSSSASAWRGPGCSSSSGFRSVELYGLWGWTREYTIEEFERGVVPEQKRQLLGVVETGLLGMYMLIVSEILIFAGFFVAWFYLDATRGPFPRTAIPG